MRTRAERRFNTERKLKYRKNLLKRFGKRDGSIFEKHRQKIDASLGYMRDGNVSHFVQCGSTKKTKNSANKHYGPKYNWSWHDLKQILNG